MDMAPAKFMTTRRTHNKYWACGLVWSMLVALGAIDPGSNPGRPTTSLLHHHPPRAHDGPRYVQGEYPPTADMGIGESLIRFVVGLMGKNPEETEEEKVTRIMAEADMRIAEAKRDEQ